MDPETKAITALVENLIVKERDLPARPDPARMREDFKVVREVLELQQMIRRKLGAIESLKIFNPKVKRKLLEIKQGGTEVDEFKLIYRRIHEIMTYSEEQLLKWDIEVKSVLAIRADQELKKELDDFFGPLLAPQITDDEFFESGEFIDFTLDIRDAAYRSEFHHQKYLDSLQEVLVVVNPERYATRSIGVGTIIVSQSVPPSVDYQLRRLKTCYCLGLDEVALVFCRAILEAALEHKLRIKSFKFYGLVSLALERRVLDPSLKQKARKIGNLAGKILHRNRNSSKDFSREAQETVRATFEIIEDLYA